MKTPAKWLENALIELRSLDREERRIGVKILECLAEIERRKAYSELGYDGIYSFCVRELRYTESQAFQRMQAVHAMNAVPEVKAKIESGAMSVTTVAQVQIHLRQERAQGVKRDAAEKLELFTQFENKTSHEVKKELAELRGERLRAKLAIELDEEAEFLWKEVRAKAAHETMGDDLNCLKLLMKDWLARREGVARGNGTTNLRRSISGLTQVQSQLPSGNSRHVPAAIRREIFKRDEAKCTNCGSKHALQIEHIVPFILGGTHEPSNLKLLCRSCNLRQGIKQFGAEAMRR